MRSSARVAAVVAAVLWLLLSSVRAVAAAVVDRGSAEYSKPLTLAQLSPSPWVLAALLARLVRLARLVGMAA